MKCFVAKIKECQIDVNTDEEYRKVIYFTNIIQLVKFIYNLRVPIISW